MINRVTPFAAPLRTLANGMNRVEPAHVPGCFKTFNKTGAHGDEPRRMSRTGVNWGAAVAIPAHSVAPQCLYRNIPAAMKTPVLGRYSHDGATMTNVGAPFRTDGDTVLHGMSRLSPV